MFEITNFISLLSPFETVRLSSSWVKQAQPVGWCGMMQIKSRRATETRGGELGMDGPCRSDGREEKHGGSPADGGGRVSRRNLPGGVERLRRREPQPRRGAQQTADAGKHENTSVSFRFVSFSYKLCMHLWWWLVVLVVGGWWWCCIAGPGVFHVSRGGSSSRRSREDEGEGKKKIE